MSPTESCQATFFDGDGCVADTTATFDTNLVLQFENPVRLELVAFLLTNVRIVYDQVAGSVCDACRRRVLDTELVPVATNTTDNYVVLKLTIGQTGGCDTAFDNDNEVVSDEHIWDFITTCGTFVPFTDSSESETCCCSACVSDKRRASLSGGISRREFGKWLGTSLNAPITDVLELIGPSENNLGCDPEQPTTTTPSFFIGLDNFLDPSDYDAFFSLFRTTYNQLCLENCFPQRLHSITPVNDVGTGVTTNDDRRELEREKRMKKSKKDDQRHTHITAPKEPRCVGKATCIKVQVERKCYANSCAIKNGMCELFGNCQRKLQGATDVLSILPSQPLSVRESPPTSQRHLQILESTGDDACLCLVGVDAHEPTFELPSHKDFLGSLNTKLIVAGFRPIEEIEEDEAWWSSSTSTYGSGRDSKKGKSARKGKGSSVGKGSRANVEGNIDAGKGSKGSKVYIDEADVLGESGE